LAAGVNLRVNFAAGVNMGANLAARRSFLCLHRQGIARVGCISGCSCDWFELDGLNSDFYATLGAGSAEVGVKLGVNFVVWAALRLL
jgi:hypothetical protein